MALGSQVVDFIWADVLKHPAYAGGIDEIAVVKVQIVAYLIDTPRVEGTRSAHEAVDFVALLQKEFSEVAAVLAGDAGYECFLHGSLSQKARIARAGLGRLRSSMGQHCLGELNR